MKIVATHGNVLASIINIRESADMALSLFFLSESIKVGSIYSLCQIFDLSLSAECQLLRERCGRNNHLSSEPRLIGGFY